MVQDGRISSGERTYLKIAAASANINTKNKFQVLAEAEKCNIIAEQTVATIAASVTRRENISISKRVHKRVFKEHEAIRVPTAQEIREKQPKKGCMRYILTDAERLAKLNEEKKANEEQKAHEEKKIREALEKEEFEPMIIRMPLPKGVQGAVSFADPEQFTISQATVGPHGGVLLRVIGAVAGKIVRCMIDCGATSDFVSSNFIRRHHLQEWVKPSNRMVRGYDGQTKLAEGTLMAALELSCPTPLDKDGVYADPLATKRRFLVADLHNEDVILGLPWLGRIDPQISFGNRKIKVKKEGEWIELPLHKEIQPEQSGGEVKTRITRSNRIITTVTNIYDEETENKQISRSMFEFMHASQKQQEYLQHRGKADYVVEYKINYKKKPPEQQEAAAAALTEKMKEEFKDIFPEELPAGLPPDRGHALRIELKPNSKIPHRTPPRTSNKHLQFEAKWITDMLKKKLISPSQSSYAAPHFYVEKPDTATSGEYRAVTDFRALNDITVKNSYPLPRADELFDKLAKAKYFSKIDLRTGFYQILIALEDRHKTAFTTSQGLFQYNVLPMGLCNSPAIFMGLMNSIFRQLLRKSVLVFLDDIVVYSDTLEEHECHLREVFQILRNNQLFVKLSKSELCRTEVEFLGHYVGKNGIRVMQDKIEAVKEWPVPKSCKELRAFLGLAGYYRRFVKGYSNIALPLSDLIRTTVGSRFTDHWKKEQDTAFTALKQALQATPVLALPDPQLPFVIDCDASGYAVGAVLQQDRGDGLRPVCFMSKKMNAAETRYPVHEQELLAIISALQTWRHHLEGSEQPIRVRTDHKSLVHFQTQPMLSGRQTRWIETLSRFNYSIEYVKGESNVVADALSRRADHNDGSIPMEREPQYVDDKRTFEVHTILTKEDSSMEVQLNAIQRNMRQQTIQQREERQKNINYAKKIYPPGELPMVLPRENKGGSRVTPTQRCTANNATGNQCGSKTAKGQYCHNHMRVHEGLRVTKSLVARAGNGLFAARDFKKGDHIADYTGDRLVLRVDQAGGPYVLQMNKTSGIDAARTNTGYGRWANDARGTDYSANTQFVLDNIRRTGRLKATKAIKKGDELFVGYGAAYWNNLGRNAKVIVRPAAGSSAADSDGSVEDPIQVNTTETLSTSVTDTATSTEEFKAEASSMVTQFSSTLIQQFEEACQKDEQYQQLMEDEQVRAIMGKMEETSVILRFGRIWQGGRLLVPDSKALHTQILQECHDSPLGGHLGRDKTKELVARYFTWRHMAKEIEEYVTTCEQCQRNKPSQQKTAGQLMPIPSPDKAGQVWTMDLITQLPVSAAGNDAIVVWVCKFSKLRHYSPCKTAITAPQLARLFMHDIVRLHGLPHNIISDRDPKFTAHFWQEFWKALGTKLNMSTAYHPQSDGQTENANRVLETMLRAVVDFDQTDWDEHLSAAELAINNAKNETTGFTPFYLYYGREATMPMDLAIAQLLKTPGGWMKNPTAVEELSQWRAALVRAKENTANAQQRQKKYADAHRREEQFVVGDRVLLASAHLKLTGETKRARKFSEQYLGPYTVTRVVNANAYELELPATLKIHPVVNITSLKRFKDGGASFPFRPIPYDRPPPVATEDSGSPEYSVERILDHRRFGRSKVIQYLILWKGYPVSEATWERIENLDGALESVIEYNQKKKIDLGVMTTVHSLIAE